MKNFKKLLFFFVPIFVLIGLTYVHINNTKDSLFSFELGIVNEDTGKEIDIFFKLYDNFKEFSNVIKPTIMSKEEAETKILNDEIPAYIVIPEDFVHDIMVGKNSPFEIYMGNTNKWPLEIIIMESVTEYVVDILTVSQAGIYSTYDYARQIGIPNETIESSIYKNINIKYLKETLGYEKIFESNIVGDGLKDKWFYIKAFLIFLMFLSGLVFSDMLSVSFNENVLGMYFLSGRKVESVVAMKFLGLVAVYMLLTVPVLPIFGFKTIFLNMIICSFWILVNVVTCDKNASNFYIFLFSCIFLFTSGSVIPFAFLPNAMKIFAYITPNYWILDGTYTSYLILFIQILVCVVTSIIILKRRRLK